MQKNTLQICSFTIFSFRSFEVHPSMKVPLPLQIWLQ